MRDQAWAAWCTAEKKKAPVTLSALLPQGLSSFDCLNGFVCDSRSYAALIAAKPHGVTMEMALRLLLLCFAGCQSIAVAPSMHGRVLWLEVTARFNAFFFYGARQIMSDGLSAGLFIVTWAHLQSNKKPRRIQPCTSLLRPLICRGFAISASEIPAWNLRGSHYWQMRFTKKNHQRHLLPI